MSALQLRLDARATDAGLGATDVHGDGTSVASGAPL